MVGTRKKLVVRWARAGIPVRAAILALCVASLAYVLLQWRISGENQAFTSNLLVFTLVNLNVVIICVLAFLIGRNVVKLVFDRRRRILGSKLRLRLVVAFVGIALVPTAIVSVIASGLLNRAMNDWFSSQVDASVNGSIEVAREYFAIAKEHLRGSTVRIASTLETITQRGVPVKKALAQLDTLRRDEGLFGVRVVGKDGATVGEIYAAAATIDLLKEPELDPRAVERALAGETVMLVEEKDGGQFVRVYYPIAYLAGPHALITSTRLSADMAHAIATISRSKAEYEQLRLFRAPLESGYVLTLAMITGLILFAAVWFGFYLARELAGPLQRLAEGMRNVAKGNYEFRVRDVADDEMGLVVQSFNTMIGELQASRAESQRNKQFVDTILANLAVGVIALDTKRGVSVVNPVAARLYEIDEPAAAVSRHLREVIGEGHYAQVEPLLELVESAESTVSAQRPLPEVELLFANPGRDGRVQCTVGRITGSDGKRVGAVLILDDITELAKAQQMAAWREVARRIAHEIKNPLTPIQLSAQRLLKLHEPGPQYRIAAEAAQSILEGVDSIKRLANEFSYFARLPTAEFAEFDLNQHVADTLAPFAEHHPQIVFQLIVDGKLPPVRYDREQIMRLLINLVDNAIAALDKERPYAALDAPESPKITVRTVYDRRRRMVTLEVSDNGPGIKDEDKARVFEPYFTTKRSGTGLGLAVVSTIVSDHQGVIRIFDNEPKGVRFTIEMPLAPQHTTQRRLALS